MSQVALFESLFKRSYPKGIGFAFSYRKPDVPIEEQRKNRIYAFFKHLSCLTFEPSEVKLLGSTPIKYEVELGFMIGKPGRNIRKEDALYHVGGYFLCIDFTSAELFEAIKRNESWDFYKNDENYFPVSHLIDSEKIKDPNNIDLELQINGETKQKANTKDLIFNVQELISHTSKYQTLVEGDMFLTGTPAGSSPVNQGDKLYAKLSQNGEVLAELNMKINLQES